MCMSSYQECSPVKEVKTMKARTKREQKVLELREQLPALTERQMSWIRNNVFTKFGYYWKRGVVWCQCCGYKDEVLKQELAISLDVDFHVCPECGETLKLVHQKEALKKTGIFAEVRCVSFITTIKGYNVVRTFNVERLNSHNEGTKIMVDEVYQNWVDENGREVILSKSYTRSIYHFRWLHDSSWGVKNHNGGYSGYYVRQDVFDVDGNLFYPVARVSAILKRNGWNKDLLKLKVNVVELMKCMLTYPIVEELVKTKQYQYLAYWMNHGADIAEWKYARWMHALRICNRNGYIVQDASMWVDYMDLLAYFHKDTYNAKYVCPKDLKAEHDRLYHKKEKRELAVELAEKIVKADKFEAQYKRHRGKFFGICFGNENIMITVICSVKEMAEEGTFMHHCVFANEYYDIKKHPGSLILSARDKDGNRLETIEVDIRTWKVIQSRGVYNQATAYHADILNLMDKNMFLLQKVV